ncbi:MAG: extensin family protein [Pseudomonadota bacterium]
MSLLGFLQATTTAALLTAPLPPERPSVLPPTPAGERAETADRVPLPPARPQRLAATPAVPVTSAPSGADVVPGVALGGLICRDPRLKGERRPDVVSSSQACGILNPVKVSEIAGVRLSTPAILNCPTARRVADWLSGVAQPAAKARLGAPIREIWVMGSYSCRTRNHLPGARISEHGKGRAIDIGGVTLGNGERLTVSNDWNNGERGEFLRELHGKACGLFHTVLGPNADRHHRNHFHFDTAQRGGNPYCR